MNGMTVEQGVKAYMDYHLANSRPNTVRGFAYTLGKFRDLFAGMDILAISESEVATFLEILTEGMSAATKGCRVSHLSAFFNFLMDVFNLEFTNPCSRGIIKKLYKKPKCVSPELLDKEIVDEIIYRSSGMERLMLELMGRTAMRIGEVLDIRPRDLNLEVSTISIEQPKSGRQGEFVYVPQKMMRRIDDYVRSKRMAAGDRIFPISYATAFRMVRRHGLAVGVKLRPHDLRRHAATQASRAGIPLEMVSKVILRHADLATTQRYLGQVSVAEASRMIESLLG